MCVLVDQEMVHRPAVPEARVLSDALLAGDQDPAKRILRADLLTAEEIGMLRDKLLKHVLLLVVEGLLFQPLHLPVRSDIDPVSHRRLRGRRSVHPSFSEERPHARFTMPPNC